MDEIEPKENNPSSGKPALNTNMTLQQAINFGEYDPGVLSNFAEWHTLSTHIQWQMIRKALEYRHEQLITQYAELNNVLDFSKKPHIMKACKNVIKQLKKLDKDREVLYVYYSGKI